MKLPCLKQYGLQHHEASIMQVSQPCLAGTISSRTTPSFFGGMPVVDHDFVWPTKDGYPLHFLGQLQCEELQPLLSNSGALLFFYDNRHWGFSPKDRGHAVVLHQHGERQLDESDLPVCTVRSWFGLRNREVKPGRYKRTNVQWKPETSFPSFFRDMLDFDRSEDEEAYAEFCDARRPLVQVGGFPCPIQADTMEQYCVKAFGGRVDDWLLLLQLFELGDMIWGDAGALYWFIQQGDLARSRFDRVWMVTQCH